MIYYKVGNLFHDVKLYKKPYMIHICNDSFKCGAGFIVPLYNRYPQTKQKYLALQKHFRVIPQGYVLVTKESDLTIFNCVAQVGIFSVNNPVPFKPKSLALALISIEEYLTANDVSATILMPRIGCGLAKGRWADIEPIIQQYLNRFNVNVYTLPHEVANYEITES